MEESLQELIREKQQILVEIEELRYIIDNLENYLVDVEEEIEEVLDNTRLKVLK